MVTALALWARVRANRFMRGPVSGILGGLGGRNFIKSTWFPGARGTGDFPGARGNGGILGQGVWGVSWGKGYGGFPGARGMRGFLGQGVTGVSWGKEYGGFPGARGMGGFLGQGVTGVSWGQGYGGFPGARGMGGFLGVGDIRAGKGEEALLGSALIDESGGKCLSSPSASGAWGACS